MASRLNTALYSSAGLHTDLPPPSFQANVVPKHIFTFWSPVNDVPDLPAACITRFKRLNPGWSVYVLYPGIKGLEPPPFQNINADNDDDFLSLPHIADWYRAVALARFGGVWMDSTSILLRPIESFFNLSSTAVQGWTYVNEQDCMENWGFAAPAESELMRRWMTEFRLAWKVGPGTYCENLQSSIVGGLAGMLPYLTMHAAYRQTIATFGNFPVGGPIASYMPPSTNWNQPFGWLKRFDFDSKAAIGWLFSNATAADFGDTPFIKIRGDDRRNIGDIYALAARGSYVAKLLIDDMPPRPPSPPPFSPSPVRGTAKEWHKTLLEVNGAAAVKLATTFSSEVISKFPTPNFNTIPPPPPPGWDFEGSQPTGQEADSPTLIATPTMPAKGRDE